ncbi:MAG: cell division protein ZapD [Proteobacteria bacterium]|nr:cell division protein ZapD [Pseudomonadota bacterium]
MRDCLFVGESFIEHFLDSDKYTEYLDLWTQALSDGFIRDCTCKEGPTPSVKWDVLVMTPVKSLGKRSVTPGPVGPRVSVPISTPSSAHPGLGGTHRVTNPAPVLHQQAAPPVVPSAQDVAQALLSFLQGGSVGTPLQRSSIPGTSSAFDLPTLGAPPSEWLAPASQKVYDLASFLPFDGTATKPKITSPREWLSAAHQLGQAMSADAGTHDFVWADFVCYLELAGKLFDFYQFGAVLAHDVAWRKWRRAYHKSWSSVNPFLRDMHLLGKELSGGSAVPGKPKPANPTAPLLCFDFSGTGCTRLASCRYLHRCRRCNTTFPASIGICPCVNGTLPPGAVLPPGVTFGK